MVADACISKTSYSHFGCCGSCGPLMQSSDLPRCWLRIELLQPSLLGMALAGERQEDGTAHAEDDAGQRRPHPPASQAQ